MKMIRSAFLVSALMVCSPSFAGHAEGNGGDHVRAMYLKMGGAVLEYLRETAEGAALIREHGLEPEKLAATLDAEKLLVVETTLADSGGSSADAIGEPGKVTLRKDRWVEHFEKDRDVYFLVFHEMLRASGYDDNSYVISKAINPFPASRRVVTRIVPSVPLLAEDLIAPYLPFDGITLGGSGCPSAKVGTSFDFDTERNVIDVSFEKYLAKTGGKESPRRIDRKACGFALPVKLPAGKRIVITQYDLLGEIDAGPGATAQLRSEAFLGGTKGENQLREIKTTGTDRTKGRILVRRTDVLKSRCGGSDLLRLNTSATLLGQQPEKADLVDVRRISLSLRLESCK